MRINLQKSQEVHHRIVQETVTNETEIAKERYVYLQKKDRKLLMI